MSLPMKKKYVTPSIEDLGSIATMTAAIGASAREDQSEFPEQFPPDGGSFDVCENNDPTEIC